MKSFPLFSLGLGLLITAVAAAWVFTTGSGASASTYTAALTLALGTLIVIWFTWRNARPTDTVAQLLHRTDAKPPIDGSHS